MGFGEDYPNASAPSAPIPTAGGLSQELAAMGLSEWEESLKSCGLTTVSALLLVESNDDLPDALPTLVKKQIVKRAVELRSNTNPAASAPLPSTDAFKISLRIISEDRDITMEVTGGSVMRDVKARFPSSVPQPNKVMFEGTCIEDHMTLTEGNVVAGSQLYIIPTRREPATIYIKSRSGAVLSVELHLHEQVTKLRSAVAGLKQCKPQEIRLTFNNEPLENDFLLLGQLNMTDGAVVYLES